MKLVYDAKLRQTCSFCRRKLPYSDFYKDSTRPRGIQSRCKDCQTKNYLGKPARQVNELMKSWRR